MLVLVFTISGCIHPSKSYMAIGNSIPKVGEHYKVIALYIGLYSRAVLRVQCAGREKVIVLYIGLYSHIRSRQPDFTLRSLVIALYIGLYSQKEHQKLCTCNYLHNSVIALYIGLYSQNNVLAISYTII